MEKLKHFSVQGTAVGSDQSIQLDEISILAEPETLRALGVFLINAASEMALNGREHVHLQEVIEDFSHEQHVDFIALNRALILPA
ncbi:hypothetical protein DNK59_20580 [Pseudomonas sp. TKO26]|uniref:Uncharacterized protein n=1 Tax=Pseudomonas saponiphila TaxID=556534 RepID=A0A1H4QP43_9PSED|nr:MULTISPECIES: hypothetical protein [Pseudomonas]PYY83117.1 hypothetical protein DNK62_20580 [Pseudomonas sp. TKO30]PYY84663.1 hypothetical protein DNK61_19955 [Pseudomonas sp. TKO29]PYY86961.1 hypothetical protein DNK59_20580 [Pseudomonas sp. TKO26]PYY98328.1 hypothetical protein DNK60_21430 [Pseudomonas sp. TKO14]SEC21375.1 hypothetical protein SAMN05216178_3854 [Pseudomonas saponiphila]